MGSKLAWFWWHRCEQDRHVSPCRKFSSSHHWDLMFHHDRGSCYNFIVNTPVCTKLYMFDKSPGLNTSTWQYFISDANWLNSAPYEISAKQPQQQEKQWTKEVMFISFLYCLKTARVWKHLHARDRGPSIASWPDVRGCARARSSLLAALIIITIWKSQKVRNLGCNIYSKNILPHSWAIKLT